MRNGALVQGYKRRPDSVQSLAAGRLSRAWNESTARYETDALAQNKYGANKEADKLIVDRLSELAEKRGLTRTQLALARCCTKNRWFPPLSVPTGCRISRTRRMRYPSGFHPKK